MKKAQFSPCYLVVGFVFPTLYVLDHMYFLMAFNMKIPKCCCEMASIVQYKCKRVFYTLFLM